MGILSICIIVFNLIISFTNYVNGYFSFFSVMILAWNLYATTNNLNNLYNVKYEKICLFLEVLTGIIILASLF